MSENNSKLYNFFFADGYRIAVLIIIILGIIFFGIVLYLAFSRKRSNFNLIFILMLNVMISSIISITGYLIEWKIGEDNNKVLLFDSNFICVMQSTVLAIFQSSRESFLTLMTFLIVLNYLNEKIDLDSDKKKYKIIIFSYCYGVPVIANIIYISIGAYGENHLFCYVKLNQKGSVCGSIHFFYLFFLLVINSIFTLFLLIHDSCVKKPIENDIWLEEKTCLNPLLKKIIFYPIAQVFSLGVPIYYRYGTFISKDKNIYLMAGIAAVSNSFSSFIYTFIFMVSNNLLLCSKKEDKKDNSSAKEMIDNRALID